MNREIRHGGWGGDTVVRFFNKERCRFIPRQVHPELQIDGQTGKLTGALIHEPYAISVSGWNASTVTHAGARRTPEPRATGPVGSHSASNPQPNSSRSTYYVWVSSMGSPAW